MTKTFRVEEIDNGFIVDVETMERTEHGFMYGETFQIVRKYAKTQTDIECIIIEALADEFGND